MSYTPGPWNIHPRHKDWNFKAYYGQTCNNGIPWVAADVPVGKGEKIICTVHLSTTSTGWPGIQNGQEFVADLNLIVSAPELLEALSVLAGAIDVGKDEWIQEANEKAKEIIKKATNVDERGQA